MNNAVQDSISDGFLQQIGQTKDNRQAIVSAADVEELRNFSDECLKMAGLKELSEKI